jgi:hypothetical protein
VIRIATRLIRFTTVSDVACRWGDSQQTMDDRHHNHERLHRPVAKGIRKAIGSPSLLLLPCKKRGARQSRLRIERRRIPACASCVEFMHPGVSGTPLGERESLGSHCTDRLVGET